MRSCPPSSPRQNRIPRQYGSRHDCTNEMTAHVPMTAQQLNLVSSSSAGIGSALDRFAYVVLCAFVFDLPWGEYVPQLGGLVLGTWIGLLAVGGTALRTAGNWGRPIVSAIHHAV